MLKPYQTLKKNNVIGYKLDESINYNPGYPLQVQLTEDGIIVYVEDLNTHYMKVVPYNNIILITPLDDLDRECLMPIEEFIECVNCGGITDYDGSGNYSDGTYIYNSVGFWESELEEAKKHYKYVCWYNK